MLYAGAAIGVSHLVQSTRAGAAYGVLLISAVVLIHIFKYSFFKAGALYPSKTGKSLVEAYYQLHPFALVLFLIMTFGSMAIVLAAIGMVTAGIMANIFPGLMSISLWAVLLFVAAVLLIRFSNIDRIGQILKWLILALSACTLLCVVLQAHRMPLLFEGLSQLSFSVFNAQDFAFLIAFLGWMPAPIDITVWQSLWITESKRQLSEKDRIQEFNIGYWGTAFMAIAFILMGALVFYGKEVTLQESAVGFTAQFLEMYRSTLGAWAYPVVAFAAVATMLSTLITCMDAYPKAISKSLECLTPKGPGIFRNKLSWLLLNALSALCIIFFFKGALAPLVDFATRLSFVLAPVLAYFNYRLLFKSHSWTLSRIISLLGLLLLLGLAVGSLAT